MGCIADRIPLICRPPEGRDHQPWRQHPCPKCGATSGVTTAPRAGACERPGPVCRGCGGAWPMTNEPAR